MDHPERNIKPCIAAIALLLLSCSDTQSGKTIAATGVDSSKVLPCCAGNLPSRFGKTVSDSAHRYHPAKESTSKK